MFKRSTRQLYAMVATITAAAALAFAGQTSNAQGALPSGGDVKTILHLSDVHLVLGATDQETATLSFDYGQDGPLRLLESALEHATRVLPHPDFVLYTGDHAAHRTLTDDELTRSVQTNVRTIERYFPSDPATPREVTAILGNDDTSASVTAYVNYTYTHN